MLKMKKTGGAPGETAMPDKKLTLRRAIAVFAIGYLVIGLALFLPAGTIQWPEAWLYLWMQIGYSAFIGTWLWKSNVGLLRERTRFLKGAKGWDKAFLLASIVPMFSIFVIAGLDYRYGWSPVGPVAKAMAFGFLALSFLGIARVMKENTYLSRVVRIQTERGHKVITTGPYRYVRHPMYVSVIVMLLSLPFALGSLYALVPVGVLLGALLVRTHLEDNTLQAELEGYREYAQRTKYKNKIVPGVW